MQYRQFGNTGIEVSEVGLGTWQIGGSWGDVSKQEALTILHTAADSGVTFYDTADVYGEGRSEKLVGTFLKERPESLFVATKIGRWGTPGWPENFTLEHMRSHVEQCLQRLNIPALDLVQLHCIPTAVLAEGVVFDHLRTLQQEGKIKRFGVSVETVEEGHLCLRQPDVTSLQVIFNMFRQKPAADLFAAAQAQGVAVIARVPLASGLLTGKMTKGTTFPDSDHRAFNRDGQAFNVGETFAGLPFEKGVELADQLKPLVPEGMSMAQMALRWILDFEAVTTVIPGASSTAQATSNVSVSDLPPLPTELRQKLADIYQQSIAPHIRGPY